MSGEVVHMRVFVTGDIHGDEDDAFWRLQGAGLMPDDVLVLLGDVGIAYGGHENRRLMEVLDDLPCDVLVVRGNHDTRYCRDMRDGTFGEGTCKHVLWHGNAVMRDSAYPGVVFAPDEGGLLTLGGKTCLVIPGAWSIDGDYRIMRGMAFEEEEQLTEEEMDAILALAASNDIDYVFSHTCPASWRDEILLWKGEDVDEDVDIDDTMEESMEDVLDECDNLQGWYFGHFHDDLAVGGIGRLVYRDVVRVA